MLIFVGIYATAGWESPAMGSHCILPALCSFHLPLYNIPGKIHSTLLPSPLLAKGYSGDMTRSYA